MDENRTNHQRKPMPKPVKWTGHEFLRSEHATHLVVQSHGSEFTLLFFELQPPFMTGTASRASSSDGRLTARRSKMCG